MDKKLPKNWERVGFTEIFGINGGTQPPKSQFIHEPKEGYIRLLQIRDFGKKPVPTYIPNTGKLRTCEKDDILIARYGASIGRIVTGEEGAYNVALAKVNIPEVMNKNFVKWLLKSHIFQNKIVSFQRTAQSGFNKDDLSGIKVPLPPLAEQQRIVAKLDELFGHLDTLKTRLNNIPQILKNFRQAVLTQAVTGKLTEEWRVGKELEEWEETNLEHLVLFAGNGLSKRSGEGEDLTVLRLADFKNGIRVFGNERKIQLTEKEQIKYTLNNNDLLIIRVNGSVDLAGLFILYNNEGNKEAFCDHFIRLTVDSERIIPLYLTYISNNGDGRLYLKNSLSTSAGQNTINQKSVKGLSINLPSVEEQTEIVKRVEHLFAKADAIEAQYQILKTKIDSLPQAILAKAFKGDLVEQLDTDGSAEVLLEEIQKLKEASLRGAKQSVKNMSKNNTKEVLGRVAEGTTKYSKR
ncbi:restriction endonuclease subunit S [uncultured Winogradskyella sp.]|uniref:restriction endonuclease subunit S n=1 Tax=uncultured Winogradskyella sp. TaxID=395353 RepID=UPI00260DCF75|nr:restriction endonuclease subunit S [uncultured Winogradskyella sp.]